MERRRLHPSTPLPSKHRNEDSTMNDAARKINNIASPPAVSLRKENNSTDSTILRT
jgi:hypothetical protein